MEELFLLNTTYALCFLILVCCYLKFEFSDEPLYPQSGFRKNLYSSVALIHVFLGSKTVPVFKVISSMKVELLCFFTLKHAIIVAVSLPTF